MKPAEYLNALLTENKLADDSTEVGELREHREEVEKVLRSVFGSAPTIRYGGSKAKGTMVKISYDLDLTCYFGCDDHCAGETLAQIHESVKKALLDAGYTVVEKTSAIRIRSGDVDFHVDVVPGRFFDEKKDDVWLHRTEGTKERLKTNLDVHIDHVRSSKRQGAICLLKLWRDRCGLTELRTFAIELLTIKILDGSKDGEDLDGQLLQVFRELKESADSIKIEDPANPDGNDLSSLLTESLRASLKTAAASTLAAVTDGGWERVFGALAKTEAEHAAAIAGAVSAATSRTKPWCPR